MRNVLGYIMGSHYLGNGCDYLHGYLNISVCGYVRDIGIMKIEHIGYTVDEKVFSLKTIWEMIQTLSAQL